MNAKHSNTFIPLIKRWHYSQKLAHWMNEQTAEQLENLKPLKEDLSKYFALLKNQRFNENYVYELSLHHKITRVKELLMLILLAPTSILGVLHCGIPYILVKRFVEKSFKRPVFWGSVKLLLGMISMGLLNIPVIFLIYYLIYPSFWVALGYYLLIGVFGLSAYMWWRNLIRFREKGYVRRSDLSEVLEKRSDLMRRIHEQIPVA
jgi:hypothetical protein